MTHTTARRTVDLARKLTKLPATAEAFAAGDITRAHAQAIARGDLIQSDILIGTVGANAPRCFGRKVKERPDRASGLFTRAQLEDLPEEDQDRHHGGRVGDGARGCRTVCSRGRKRGRCRHQRRRLECDCQEY